MAGARFAKYMRPLVDALRELGTSGTPSEVPSELGIDLAKPDFVYGGFPLHLEKGQVRLFWTCGATPQAVATASRRGSRS